MLAPAGRKALPQFVFTTLIALFSLLLISCGEEAKRPFDPKSGIVTKELQLDQAALTPIEVRVDSEYKSYYIEDHLVFISAVDQPERAVTVHLGRGLQDNKYIRAERDFFGFYFDGRGMASLAYTKMKHDSSRLDVNYPYYTFGGLTWTARHQAGKFEYDRRGVSFTIEFSDLKPVQNMVDHDWRKRTNAIGEGTLISDGDTISGYIFYELIQLEDYNPIEEINTGVDYVNYDWMALRTESGERLLVSTDSSTENDILMKNFTAFDRGDAVWFADGTDNVEMTSSEVLRDRKIHDWLANKKLVEVPKLGMTIDLSLTDTKIFYTSGYAFAIVEGTLKLEGGEERVRGILEHRQQPGTNSEVIK